MEKQYGLRSLAVDHAGMLLKSIQKYTNTDNEILVFNHILRNELEEDFHFIQSELLKSIIDLSMIQLMTRYTNKDNITLQNLLDNKINNGFIFEEEWIDLIKYLYYENDFITLNNLLKKLAVDINNMNNPNNESTITLISYPNTTITSKQDIFSPILHISPKNNLLKNNYIIGTNNSILSNNNTNNNNNFGYDKFNNKDIKKLGYSSPTLKINLKDPNSKLRKDMLKLNFQLFIKTILDFQLKVHLNYINNFYLEFQLIDTDHDGVINANQFKEIFFNYRKKIINIFINDSFNNLIINNNNKLKSLPNNFNNNKVNNNNKQNNNNNKLENKLIIENIDLQNDENELKLFLEVITLIDPIQSDKITFSNIINQLNKIDFIDIEKYNNLILSTNNLLNQD